MATIADGIRFTMDDAMQAHDEWGFSCGPAALCAVFGCTPEEIRPRLWDFETKRYVNPTLMAAILRGMNVPFRRLYECAVKVDGRNLFDVASRTGLARIQWGGPWMKEGVPVGAQYRQTHWVAYSLAGNVLRIFDVNAVDSGWMNYYDWAREVVPGILAEVKRADGTFWPTHVWEIGHAER